MSDPLAALARDFEDVADRLADTSTADRAAGEELAAAMRGEVPVRSGYLAGSIVAGAGYAEATAVYAGVIATGSASRGIEANPYHERAADRADLLGVYAAHAEDSLDALRRFYS